MSNKNFIIEVKNENEDVVRRHQTVDSSIDEIHDKLDELQ